MKKLHKLLFELSSSERMSILLALQQHRLRLSQISRRLDLTVAEASRHLHRLSEARLIEKDTTGSYEVTQYGKLVLSLLSGLGFVIKHQDYFLEYDVSCLPDEFVGRMGELTNGEFGADIFRNIELTEKEFREAEEFIWVMSDQILKSLIPVVAGKVKQTFDTRFIFPETVMPPDSKAPIPSTLPGIQKRVLPKVEAIVIVTDKAAGFCLPNSNGRIDYRNLNGNDSKFRKWCKDLFLYYWEKAKPFRS
jgi:predicted transcriptional regulator